jgi:hypothetical protein
MFFSIILIIFYSIINFPSVFGVSDIWLLKYNEYTIIVPVVFFMFYGFLIVLFYSYMLITTPSVLNNLSDEDKEIIKNAQMDKKSN